MIFFFFLVVCFCLSQEVVSGFLYNPQAHPHLASLSTTLDTSLAFQLKLDLNLVGASSRSSSAARLAVNGPTLSFQNEAVSNDLYLPGMAHYRHISTGVSALNLHQSAYYVNSEGQQWVEFDKSCWEIIWIQDNNAGKLNCAFDLPFPIHRYGFTFEAGPLYVTFAVYSQESLAVAQALRARTLELSKQFREEKQNELEKCNATNNPIAKAFHYQRAFAAIDKLLVLPTVSNIPETMNDVVKLGSIFVVPEGVVWRRTREGFSAGVRAPFFRPSEIKVGNALLSLSNFRDDNADIERHRHGRGDKDGKDHLGRIDKDRHLKLRP